MSEIFSKQEVLKNLIKRLHEEPENVEEIKERFRSLIRDLSSLEISQVEQELVDEGMPVEEIRNLCDVHLEVFRQAVEENSLDLPAGHPIQILYAEHNAFLREVEKLREVAKEARQGVQPKNLETIVEVKKILQVGENHYLREENVLFPLLEKHGVVQPPAIMWQEHDTIRELKKGLFAIIDNPEAKDFASRLDEQTIALYEMLSGHFYKENKVLFPTALQVFSNDLWPSIREEFDEIGYVFGTPAPMADAQQTPEAQSDLAKPAAPLSDEIDLNTGALSRKELLALFSSLPVDLTFVDAGDKVKFFSESDDRIFVRTKAVIGRSVQLCHPKKSVHVVEQIVNDFKSGKRSKADFWLEMADRFVLIRYFAVRDKDGSYMGTLEVTQDVTEIRKLEGEKRIYSEET